MDFGFWIERKIKDQSSKIKAQKAMAKNKHLSGNLFTKTPLTIRESSLSARIAEYLHAKGIYHDRLNCGTVKTDSGNWLYLCKTGTPDRFAIVRGYIVFIEVKRLGEKPTPEQIKRHEELRKSGAIVLIVDTFESFIKEFSAIHGKLQIEISYEKTQKDTK